MHMLAELSSLGPVRLGPWFPVDDQSEATIPSFFYGPLHREVYSIAVCFIKVTNGESLPTRQVIISYNVIREVTFHHPFQVLLVNAVTVFAHRSRERNTPGYRSGELQ